MRSRVLGFAIILIMLTVVVAFAQRGRGAAQPARPTPHYPDGRVSFAPIPGENGVWLPGAGGAETLVAPDNPNPAFAQFLGQPFPGKKKIREVPFQPWAKALFEYRRANNDRDSPHARCKPDAGPRQIGTAYGFEIVEFRDIQRVIIFDIGGPQGFRTIYMDGRTHPKGPDLILTYDGHAVGWWEGDTLTVDTVGFNEQNWIDPEGLVHTDQYHQLERFTRTDFNTLRYEVTIDDPGAYTAPWTEGFLLRWEPGAEIFEVGAEVVEVGLAVRAADHVAVELDVVEQLRVAGPQQEPAELLPRRATHPLPPPTALSHPQRAPSPDLNRSCTPSQPPGRHPSHDHRRAPRESGRCAWRRRRVPTRRDSSAQTGSIPT